MLVLTCFCTLSTSFSTSTDFFSLYQSTGKDAIKESIPNKYKTTIPPPSSSLEEDLCDFELVDDEELFEWVDLLEDDLLELALIILY